VYDPVLLITVGRCPGPAGLFGEHDHPIEVRMQPQVTDRSPGIPARHDRVIRQKRVEHRRCPDAPRGGMFQPLDRNRLDPSDTAVVHPGGGQRDHTLLDKLVAYAAREIALPFPFSLIHLCTPVRAPETVPC